MGGQSDNADDDAPLSKYINATLLLLLVERGRPLYYAIEMND